MVRTLDAQARAIWPQEQLLFERYYIPASARVLDLGCGTGEITARLAEQWPQAHIVGVDLVESHLVAAREHAAQHAERVSFEAGDAFDLRFEAESFDFVLCRHLFQAVPRPEAVVAEIQRVLASGGAIHLLVEDYGLIHHDPTRLDTDAFWREFIGGFGRATGTEMLIGRKMLPILRDAGFKDIRVEYLTIDSLRVDPQVIAEIWSAWRDGYRDGLAQTSGRPVEVIDEHFDDMIQCLQRPDGYGVWHIPIWSARK